jgi:diguanylate cyclase
MRINGQVLALRQPFVVDGHELRVDASIGLALYPQHGSAPRLLMQAAAAMRAVKQAGGGGHAEFEASMGVDMRQRAELLRDLRQAVAQQRLQLVYQPKVDAARCRSPPPRRCCAGTIRSAASSARRSSSRWPSATASSATSAAGSSTRPAARPRNGAARACACAWPSTSRAAPVRKDDLVEHLCESLRRHGMPPARFTCEITESVAMEDTAQSRGPPSSACARPACTCPSTTSAPASPAWPRCASCRPPS